MPSWLDCKGTLHTLFAVSGPTVSRVHSYKGHIVERPYFLTILFYLCGKNPNTSGTNNKAKSCPYFWLNPVDFESHLIACVQLQSGLERVCGPAVSFTVLESYLLVTWLTWAFLWASPEQLSGSLALQWVACAQLQFLGPLSVSTVPWSIKSAVTYWVSSSEGQWTKAVPWLLCIDMECANLITALGQSNDSL